MNIIHTETKKQEVNMCQAIEEMIEDGKIEGKKEGKIEGEREGKKQILFELVRDGMLSAEAAAHKMSVKKEDFLEEMKKHPINM